VRAPMPADFGFEERFSNKIAIAPTASISIICGGASAGIEPSAANVYNHKTLSGSFVVAQTRTLRRCWSRRAANYEETWTSNHGPTRARCGISTCLDDHEKAVFKDRLRRSTSRWLVETCRPTRAPVHLPEPVAEHFPAGQRSQARPCIRST